MANPSPIPLPDPRQTVSDNTVSESRTQAAEELPSAQPVSVTAPGPRKLVRPSLPARAFGSRTFFRRNDITPLAHHEAMATEHIAHESTHAEAFYFQKQAQSQTPMVFILEDGERIEGYIEWYDRNAIKVKNHTRTLIYKSSIKYLYKANETHHRI